MGFAMVLTVAAQAFADCRSKIALTESLSFPGAAAAIDTSGTAEARKVGAQDRFKVGMDARVDPGTTFAVFANGNLVGAITIDQFGDGELGLNNNNDNVLPAGFGPFCTIGTVQVGNFVGLTTFVAVLTGSL